MKKISIWAPLRYSNYGDDMQAIAFAKYITNCGYEVKLYQLDKSLAELYGLETVQTIYELCSDVKLCIIAGGGLLTPLNKLRRMLNPVYADYEMMFRDLCMAIEKYGTKFCAISMGGDGKQHIPYLMYGKWRRKFFSSPNFINGSVRLEGDALQMKKHFGKEFVYYPDMLFKSPDFFEATLLPVSKKIRVALNFKKNRNYKYLDKKLVNDIIDYAHKHDDIEFHFITTHLDSVGQTYQYLPAEETKNVFIDKYTSPSQLLGVLASCDVLVTSMLHPGITGLSIGTPFVSYRGPGKAHSFLKSIGGEWAILDDNISFDTLLHDYIKMGKDSLYCNYDILAIEKYKEDSSMNYELCSQIIEMYA